MSLLPTIGAVDQDTGFYNGVATQSLRFDDDSSAYLTRTPSGAGNQKTWTFSTWLKRGVLNPQSQILSVGNTGAGAPWFLMYLADDDNLNVYWYNGSDVNANQTFTPKFRDTSAWYNIVLRMDTTQNTDSNRVKLYINGVEASHGNSQYPKEDYDTLINGTSVHHIGRHGGGSYFDGYLAETIMLDGTSTDASSFGETKNGIWIPIDTSGLTFGTNGFRLQFEDNAVGTPENEGVVEDDNIGRDSSGEHNHWTSSGIVASDCNMPDSPENNFATLNTLDKVLTSSALSEGNLSVSAGGNAWNNIINSTFSLTSGKWYWEVIALTGAGFGKIGVRQNNSLTSADSHSAGASEVYLFNGNKQQGSTSTDSAYYGSAMYGDGNIFGIALDMDAGKIWVAKNNTYGNSGNPATGANAMFDNLTEPQSPSFSSYNMPVTFNFGQDGSFAGDLTSGIGTATDGNGNGLFKYAPPSGFLALCSANLPEPTIGPNSDTQAVNHFGTLTYTGDGNSTQNIRSGASGIGGEIDFKPDFTWTKGRIVANSHLLYDSSRGAGASKGLKANGGIVEGENDNSTFGYLSSFETNGFNVVKGSTSDHSFMNQNNKTLVGWNWKANGGTVSNSAADSISTGVPTRASGVQANTTAGFSIVTYTGDGGTAIDTYAHGLGVVPELIICKNRQTTDDWLFGATAIPSFNWVNDYMHWNEPEEHQTNAGGTAFKAAPTDEVFSVGEFLNKANNYVAYLFASVKGYSKIGTYKGNGLASGTFVHLGFRPAWVMIKAVSGVTGQYWCIFDNKRDPFNDQASQVLYVNASDAEGTGGIDIDFLSNGMKMRDDGNNHNSSSGVYIYMAFAEAPFKYANAR